MNSDFDMDDRCVSCCSFATSEMALEALLTDQLNSEVELESDTECDLCCVHGAQDMEADRKCLDQEVHRSELVHPIGSKMLKFLEREQPDSLDEHAFRNSVVEFNRSKLLRPRNVLSNGIRKVQLVNWHGKPLHRKMAMQSLQSVLSRRSGPYARFSSSKCLNAYNGPLYDAGCRRPSKRKRSRSSMRRKCSRPKRKPSCRSSKKLRKRSRSRSRSRSRLRRKSSCRSRVSARSRSRTRTHSHAHGHGHGHGHGQGRSCSQSGKGKHKALAKGKNKVAPPKEVKTTGRKKGKKSSSSCCRKRRIGAISKFLLGLVSRERRKKYED